MTEVHIIYYKGFPKKTKKIYVTYDVVSEIVANYDKKMKEKEMEELNSIRKKQI